MMVKCQKWHYLRCQKWHYRAGFSGLMVPKVALVEADFGRFDSAESGTPSRFCHVYSTKGGVA